MFSPSVPVPSLRALAIPKSALPIPLSILSRSLPFLPKPSKTSPTPLLSADSPTDSCTGPRPQRAASCPRTHHPPGPASGNNPGTMRYRPLPLMPTGAVFASTAAAPPPSLTSRCCCCSCCCLLEGGRPTGARGHQTFLAGARDRPCQKVQACARGAGQRGCRVE